MLYTELAVKPLMGFPHVVLQGSEVGKSRVVLTEGTGVLQQTVVGLHHVVSLKVDGITPLVMHVTRLDAGKLRDVWGEHHLE